MVNRKNRCGGKEAHKNTDFKEKRFCFCLFVSAQLSAAERLSPDLCALGSLWLLAEKAESGFAKAKVRFDPGRLLLAC